MVHPLNATADAVYGLRELLQRHPSSILDHLGAVFEVTFPLLVDTVRIDRDRWTLRTGH